MIGLVIVIALWRQSTANGVIALVCWIALAAWLESPRRCQVCSKIIKRGRYVWHVEGKKMKVCPKCNDSLERKMSKAGIKNLFS